MQEGSDAAVVDFLEQFGPIGNVALPMRRDFQNPVARVVPFDVCRVFVVRGHVAVHPDRAFNRSGRPFPSIVMVSVRVCDLILSASLSVAREARLIQDRERFAAQGIVEAAKDMFAVSENIPCSPNIGVKIFSRSTPFPTCCSFEYRATMIRLALPMFCTCHASKFRKASYFIGSPAQITSRMCW